MRKLPPPPKPQPVVIEFSDHERIMLRQILGCLGGCEIREIMDAHENDVNVYTYAKFVEDLYHMLGEKK